MNFFQACNYLALGRLVHREGELSWVYRISRAEQLETYNIRCSRPRWRKVNERIAWYTNDYWVLLPIDEQIDLERKLKL